MFRSKKIFLLLALYILLSAGTASAETLKLVYPWSGAATPGDFISLIYKWALGIVGAAAFGVIIYGAILYTVSAGNASRQQEARNWISGAVWGIVLLLGAYVILYTINPDLVKIRQTQDFLDSLVKPVSIPKPPAAALPSEVIAADSQIRSEINKAGIGVNKGACQYASQTDCTNLAGLPTNAVSGLLKMANECSGCNILITGGTEAGHKEHGSGKPVVDLRLKSSTGYINTALLTYIRDKVGLKSGIFSAEKMEYDRRYTAKDGSFTVIREKNDAERTEHLHIVFN